MISDLLLVIFLTSGTLLVVATVLFRALTWLGRNEEDTSLNNNNND